MPPKDIDLKSVTQNYQQMNKPKIAIISNADKLWSLHAWNNVFSSGILQKDYEVAGFWSCNQKFSNKKKLSAWSWYLKNFGFWNFFKLGLFVIFFQFFACIKWLWGKHQLSFKALSKKYHVPFYKINHPNNAEFIKWVKEQEIDILLIMVDHILKKDVLAAPKMYTLNKHAGLLPANKGLFPYFWAKLKQQPQGISFHEVTEAIDEGKLFYQETVQDVCINKSMVSFYYYVHSSYHRMLGQSLQNIKNNVIIAHAADLPHSYHSLPEKSDYVQFKKKGGDIIRWADLKLPLKLFRH
jgi:folate-dependent phosphoribosylglycinamide formyltransferase PurN